MAVRITRPTLKDISPPQLHFNWKGFYCLNLQAISDCNRKFVWWNLGSVGSTHDGFAWACTPLARQLTVIGLPFGFWIAGDDAYPSSEYLIYPYSAKSARLDNNKDNFIFYQSRFWLIKISPPFPFSTVSPQTTLQQTPEILRRKAMD